VRMLWYLPKVLHKFKDFHIQETICKYGSIRHQEVGRVIRFCDTYHYDSVWSETAKLKLSCLTLHTRLCSSIVCITAVTFVLCGIALRPHSVHHSPHTRGLQAYIHVYWFVSKYYECQLNTQSLLFTNGWQMHINCDFEKATWEIHV
jgi:hypothetical protein